MNKEDETPPTWRASTDSLLDALAGDDVQQVTILIDKGERQFLFMIRGRDLKQVGTEWVKCILETV